MNDKINSTINTLPPFKNFCMTIGELPSSYMQSMSYYEAMIWLSNYLEKTVIPTVNNNAEAVNELQELFVKLQNYVNNYFDNLDVQQEINNKLDIMVEDGTIGNMLRPYILEMIKQLEEQNAKINSLINIDVLNASSTSDMTDTSKIYVNTTDNNWYYYNGSAWVIGGKYQANIEEGSITEGMVRFHKRNLEQLFDKDNINQIKAYPDLTTSKMVSNNNSRSLFISCSPNTTYTIRKEIGKKFVLACSETVPEVGTDITNIYGDPNQQVTTKQITYTTDSTANYLIFLYTNTYQDSSYTPEMIANTIMIELGSSFTGYLPYWSLDITDDDITNYSLTPNKFNINYINMFFGTAYIDEKNHVINFYNPDFISSDLRHTYHPTDDLETTINFPQNFQSSRLYLVTATITNNKVSEINIIDYSNYNNELIIFMFNVNKHAIVDTFDYNNRVQFSSYLSLNPLWNKKIGGLGDSLMAGNTLGNNYTWLNKLAKKYNMTPFNYGINGSTIAYSNANPMCIRYNDMDDNLDYIIVIGGANDKNKNIPIGQNNDNINTTFKGALNILIEGLLQKYPSKKILFLTNYNRYQTQNNIGLTDKDYVDAMIEICEKYAIPCFDNYRKSGISWETNIQTSWCDEGISLGQSMNRHLSDEAYNFLVPVYESLLKSI